jgi:hypothetical protein
MKKLLYLSLLFASYPASAAYEFTGLIKTLYLGPAYGSKVFIEVDGSPTGTVGCDAADQWSFAFDASSAEGKVYLATLLSAYSTQRTVRLISTDDCNVYAQIASLGTIWLK